MAEIVAQRYSRRQALFGGVASTTALVFGSSLLTACGGDDGDNAGGSATAPGAIAARSGTVVTLSGTTTDATAVSWQQTSGPAVTLNNALTNTATFIAPSVSSATALGFAFQAANRNRSSPELNGQQKKHEKRALRRVRDVRSFRA